MHGSRQSLEQYVHSLSSQSLPSDVTVVLFPPSGYLTLLAGALQAAGLTQQVQLGAQNVHQQPEGAYTGEISAPMLRDLGAQWVLVGHSERRQYQAEDDALVAAKAAAALASGLIPVICVGESEVQRDAGSAEQVVGAQLEVVARQLGAAALQMCVIAYEPIWAIGTGKTATAEIAQTMHAAIRDRLAGWCGDAAGGIRLLYGGSVKSGNAPALFTQTDIDGGLIGGASLDAEEFAGIASAAGTMGVS